MQSKPVPPPLKPLPGLRLHLHRLIDMLSEDERRTLYEDLAERVREYHVPAFSRWTDHHVFEKAFAGLMRDLRREDAIKA